MTANPVELIGGLTTNANVVKADLVSWAKARVPQVMADFTEARNTVLAGQLVITFKSTAGFWYQDTTDTTTADDGSSCIVSLDSKRFKPLAIITAPTTLALGGVFASAAIAGQYVTGLDTAGNLLRASVDTDGTFASNSDTKIASQKAVKTYVDTVAQGLDPKASVLVATTANITLSGEQTLDGFLTAASRVLVKNQTAPAQNGIYVSAAGAWTRSTDADAWTELPGAFVFVEKGTLYGDTGWVCTVDAGGTIDSTSVTFTQFSGAGTYTAGTGLTLTGTQFAIDTSVTARVGQPLSQFAATTSAQLLGVISDETGSGALVFANTPLLVTPNIGAATGTSLAATGALSSNGTAGIGYATGAGGAVTQATSRGTGVTLNKTSGAITLFSAAGSPGVFVFTVTNSTVAATDTISLSVKSATNTYHVFVTAVAAGSFQIGVIAVAGTATDAPVFNFNVIKGVAA